jgi:hypothetical protein
MVAVMMMEGRGGVLLEPERPRRLAHNLLLLRPILGVDGTGMGDL